MLLCIAIIMGLHDCLLYLLICYLEAAMIYTYITMQLLAALIGNTTLVDTVFCSTLKSNILTTMGMFPRHMPLKLTLRRPITPHRATLAP